MAEYTDLNGWPRVMVAHTWAQRLGMRGKMSRLGQRLSQQQIADKVGVHRTTIAKWENGKRVPDSRMLYLWAKALNCKVSELLPQ